MPRRDQNQMIDLIRETPLYKPALGPLRKLELLQWQRNGRASATPHLWKQAVLKSYAARYDLHTLVETGTYMGEMAAAMRQTMEKIFTIELSEALHHRALKRFAGDSAIHVLHGDSAVVLGRLAPELTTPCLFWLDAHYSAGVTARGDMDTPVVAEINQVLRQTELDHVVLIDDAAEFNGLKDYPSIDAVQKIAAELRPDWTFCVAENIIRIQPLS